MNKKEKIVNMIISDICDRNGLQNIWEDIDDDVRQEIRRTWEKGVQKILDEKSQ